MIYNKKFKYFLPIILPFCFFILSIALLGDYGMNWDGPIHYARGQAYLRFLVTGKEDYIGEPRFCRNEQNINSRIDYKTGEICDKSRKIRVSEYESELLDYRWAKENDNNGHPPATDILSAITNQIFYKKLGLLEDIEAYNLFHVFMTFILASVVSVWSYRLFGIFSSMIATFVVYLYPLLFAEQFFNVKDPAMAAFFTLAIFFFWYSFFVSKVKYIYLSALFGGLSFATKFNFIFGFVILALWIILSIIFELFDKNNKRNITRLAFSRKYIIAFFLYPFIVFFVFFGTWPILWDDPIKRILTVFNYYYGIGGGGCGYAKFTINWFLHCTNNFALSYFFFSIPLITLGLFFLGSFFSLLNIRKNLFVNLLWLLVILITIGRVTFSITSIYGGLRQILEFIAPVALLSGYGFIKLKEYTILLFNKRLNINSNYISLFVSTLIIVLYFILAVQLIKLHPNQNLYFNELIGGLKGAADRDFPGYGNTYGNGYKQIIAWLNNNAEKNAKLSMLFGNAQNISRAGLREDILFANYYISGYKMLGEYQVLLLTQGLPVYKSFYYQFMDKFFTPIYDLKVQNVSIVKIWKNDKKFLKTGIDFSEKITPIKIDVELNSIYIRLQSKMKLKRLEIQSGNTYCLEKIKLLPISIALENNDYLQMYDTINDFTQIQTEGYKDIAFLFSGDISNSIKLGDVLDEQCKMNDLNFKVYVFINL